MSEPRSEDGRCVNPRCLVPFRHAPHTTEMKPAVPPAYSGSSGGEQREPLDLGDMTLRPTSLGGVDIEVGRSSVRLHADDLPAIVAWLQAVLSATVSDWPAGSWMDATSKAAESGSDASH